MRRLLQVRLLFVLIALLLLPALAIPYAERVRTEWERYWRPPIADADQELIDEINAAIEEATRSSGGCSIIVPAVAADEMDRVERERFEAKRRLLRNEQLARELADVVANSRELADEQRLD